LVALATLVRVTGALSLTEIYGALTPGAWARALPALALVAMTLVVLLLVENTRIPVDDPATHLELTMIHEVMVLDHSGPDLGLIHYAAALKLWSLGALFVGLVVVPPRSFGLWLDGAAALLGMASLAVIIGMVESGMARYRLVRVPQFIVGAATLSVVAFIVLLV
jgi:formate hydrogenlyase subunit 4